MELLLNKLTVIERNRLEEEELLQPGLLELLSVTSLRNISLPFLYKGNLANQEGNKLKILIHRPSLIIEKIKGERLLLRSALNVLCDFFQPSRQFHNLFLRLTSNVVKVC